MKWISVEESLPGLWEDVLCLCVDKTNLTYRMGETYMAIDRLVKWVDSDIIAFRTDLFIGKVTHWMPLPDYPKNDEK